MASKCGEKHSVFLRWFLFILCNYSLCHLKHSWTVFFDLIFKRKQRSNLLDNEFLEIIWKVMNWKWMILVWMQNIVSIRPFAFHFLQIQCTKKVNGHRFSAITGQIYNYNIGMSGQFWLITGNFISGWKVYEYHC